MAMAAIRNIRCIAGSGYELVEDGLQEGADAYIDSDATYTGVPEELVGADYVKTANVDNINAGVQYELTVIDCTLYIILDDSVGSLPWMSSGDVGGVVFEDTGLDVVIHQEFALDRICSIWAARVPPGTYTLGPQGSGLGGMYGIVAVTHPLVRLSQYSNGEGTGEPSVYSGNFDLLEETLGDEGPRKFYCASGYYTPDDHYIELHYSPIVLHETIEFVVEHIEYASTNPVTVATASYNDKGQILEIEQVNKDPCEPNDTLIFEYDEKDRLTSVELRKGGPLGALMGGMNLSGYCENCPRALRKRPRNVTHFDISDPNRNMQVNASFNLEARLVSLGIIHGDSNDYTGNFVFGYNTQGQMVTMSYIEDTNGDGECETPVVNGTFTYDTNDRLVEIYDTVCDSNILLITDGDNLRDYTITSTFGDPNVDTIRVTKVNWENFTIEKNAVPYVEVSVPEDGNLPVQLRNWNWWGDPDPPGKASADVSWARLDHNLGDPNISDRVMLAVLDPNGGLEATVNDKKKGIGIYGLKGFTYKVYKDRQDVRGIGMNERIGVTYYQRADDGSTFPVLTVLFSDGLVVKGKILVHSNSELLNKHMDNNTSFQILLSVMQDSYPEGLGLKVMSIYSTTGNGTTYIAGAVTPDGVYSYFQYDAHGDIEAVIRMNDVLEADCTEEIAGDINDDCKVDFTDFAIIAADWLKCNLDPNSACWD